MRVYLAGKMGGRLGREVIEERLIARRICERYNVAYIDPAQNENVRLDELIDMRMDSVTMKNFVAKDLYAISHCDAVLVLTGDTTSSGTSWEMGFAHFKLGIPVVMVSPKRANGELMDFSNILTDAIFSTVEEAVQFISENYREVKYAIHGTR